jgi:hypothetical protein
MKSESESQLKRCPYDQADGRAHAGASGGAKAPLSRELTDHGADERAEDHTGKAEKYS